ncbi:MAG: hypothetical protein ACRC0R_04785 [Cetobacterium sp.]
MLKNIDVIFKKGEILNFKMLEEIKKFPKNLLEIEYNQYSNGIIKGLEFFYDENKNLLIQPGIIKHKNFLYLLEKSSLILKRENLSGNKEGDTYIYLKEKENETKENICVKEISLNITKNEDCDGIFLGRFVMRQNILPKLEYEKLEDFGNDSFMNIIERKYSDIENSTISPKIINKISLELLKLEYVSPLENYIITKGLDKKVLSFCILKSYLEIVEDSISNRSIYLKIKQKIGKEKTVENKLLNRSKNNNFETKNNEKEEEEEKDIT